MKKLCNISQKTKREKSQRCASGGGVEGQTGKKSMEKTHTVNNKFFIRFS